ncbi:DUF1345 domain-containing protein [Cnuibacter sp. UC19_7]|uniref:DUF1345 domain-containing protein n=1 Tax=Cnuibacter sp. UC19_7 TaxID=3350166 RepID=UPI00366E93DC
MNDARGLERQLRRRAVVRFVVAALVGVGSAVLISALGFGRVAAVGGWAAACCVYVAWVWLVVGRMDGEATRRHARREDPTRPATDVLLLAASVASLVVVFLVLTLDSGADSGERDVVAVVAAVSVALSWALVHTLYTLRYAALYYSGEEGGVGFNQDEPPTYQDFAYLAFTLGMTFQVSDTAISTSAIRHTVLRHALLSYLFGAVILGTMVNLIAGLAS